MAPVKDRVQKHREGMKKDPEKWEAFKQKERDRDRLRRLKKKDSLKHSPRLQQEARRRVNDRVKAHRERKKLLASSQSTSQTCESPIGTYNCSRSFGKAVNRVKHSLPNSPNKKTAVLKKLVTDVIGSDFLVNTSKRIVKHQDLTAENKSLVEDFFCRDDISRQAPGMKDVLTVRKKGKKKQKVQKRFLVMTVGEAFTEFKKTFPNVDVGKSNFYSWRPDHVCLVSDTPHDVCVCKIHFNVINLLESINKGIRTITNNHNGLIIQLCCDPDSENCMYGLCSQCTNEMGKMIPVDTDLQKKTSWKQWEEDINGRPVLREHSGTYEDALKNLTDKLPKFKKHVFVKKIQSDYFQKCKNEIAADEAVMQFDFAENYALVSQDEIQSAHWSHSQVTLFTCCVWLQNKVVQSYVVISDDRSHSKYSVYTYIKALLEEVKKLNQQMTKIYIFSDNCAGQFKSRYTLSNLCFFEADFKLDVEWNFFASSHGKGAVDGIGGTVKRNVWTAVKSRTVNITNAKEFHEYVDKIFQTKIKSLYISKEDVNQNESMLDKRWKKVKPILGIQSCHHFRPYNCKDLLIAKTSTSLMNKVCVFECEEDHKVLKVKRRLSYTDVYSESDSSDEESNNTVVEIVGLQDFPSDVEADFKEKDFVVVVYEGEYFPGQVTEVKREDKIYLYKVQCMTKSGANYWKWPEFPDVMFYTRNEILKKIDNTLVTPVSSRGIFKVEEPVLEAAWLQFKERASKQ